MHGCSEGRSLLANVFATTKSAILSSILGWKISKFRNPTADPNPIAGPLRRIDQCDEGQD
jgi:hypothetical protein